MSDINAKMAAQRFTAAEVARFIMDIPGEGDVSEEENILGEEGDAEVDPEVHLDSGSDSDYSQETVEEVNEPSTSRGRGRGHGKTFDVVVVVVVGGEDI